MLTLLAAAATLLIPARTDRCSIATLLIPARTDRCSIIIACVPKNAYTHTPYSRKDDLYLWSNSDNLEDAALALGRGVKSCEARLKRLRNLNSEGHKRLFGEDCLEEDGCVVKEASLRPARECFQRITYDPSLSAADFRIGYRDRFRTTPCEVAFDAPNDSIKGGARSLIQALPEHRVEYIKYRRRLVWHKQQRLDDIFGSKGGARIQQVVESYESWDEARRQRVQRAVARALHALGGSADGEGGARALAAFKELLNQVLNGDVEPQAFADATLSPDFFGANGYGTDDAAGDVDAPAIELIGTLSDEHAELRDELTSLVRSRMIL